MFSAVYLYFFTDFRIPRIIFCDLERKCLLEKAIITHVADKFTARECDNPRQISMSDIGFPHLTD
ncbi:MAG: hypothetical protein CMM32_09410 [Rhodospirillaceae bacterium]|nr:hypothetical protein [Rhodospirillaceae bacterium]